MQVNTLEEYYQILSNIEGIDENPDTYLEYIQEKYPYYVEYSKNLAADVLRFVYDNCVDGEYLFLFSRKDRRMLRFKSANAAIICKLQLSALNNTK